MTKLALINYLVQFLFIRIFKNQSIVDGKIKIKNYGVLYWVVPLTGWWNDYIILNKDNKLKFWHWA